MRSLAHVKAMRAEIKALRGSLGLRTVRMSDGTTRDVDEARVYAEGMSALRAGVDSPWFGFVRDIVPDDDPNGPIDVLALLRDMAFDGDTRRVVEDLSDDGANAPPARKYEPTPEDEAREAEDARLRRIRDAAPSELTPDERRERRRRFNGSRHPNVW